jgi:hypothetical protein
VAFSADPGKDRRYDVAYHPGAEPERIAAPRRGGCSCYTPSSEACPPYSEGIGTWTRCHDIRNEDSAIMTRPHCLLGENGQARALNFIDS